MSTPAVTNALTIDFEDWYQGLEIPHTEWNGFEDRIVPVGRRLLALFADAGVRATFFILGKVAQDHPEIVREIAAAGHDVGTHGYSHTLIYTQTPEVFREELALSIRLLTESTRKAITGHRGPFFSITKQSSWALDILAGTADHWWHLWKLLMLELWQRELVKAHSAPIPVLA